MSGNKAFVMPAVTIALSFLGAAPAAAGSDRDRGREPYVVPCSLDGVNPVDHPSIFGNPAFAKASENRFARIDWKVSISTAGTVAALCDRRYAYERSRKIAKISSADFALARLSRTERSFRNFAIDANVRRCV